MGSFWASHVFVPRPFAPSRAAWRVPIDRSRRDGAFWPDRRGFRGLFCRTVQQGWGKLAPRPLGDVSIVVIRYSGLPGWSGRIRTGMAQAAGGGRGGERGRTRVRGEGGGRGGRILLGGKGKESGKPGKQGAGGETGRKRAEHYTQRLLGSLSLPR